MPHINFNQRAAIAATIEDLRNDKDTPVYVDGDIWTGRDFTDMDNGEAARIVVDAVVDHPYIQQAFTERDRLWNVLKWIAINDGLDPDGPADVKEIMSAAFEAALLEEADPQDFLNP